MTKPRKNLSKIFLIHPGGESFFLPWFLEFVTPRPVSKPYSALTMAWSAIFTGCDVINRKNHAKKLKFPAWLISSALWFRSDAVERLCARLRQGMVWNGIEGGMEWTEVSEWNFYYVTEIYYVGKCSKNVCKLSHYTNEWYTESN